METFISLNYCLLTQYTKIHRLTNTQISQEYNLISFKSSQSETISHYGGREHRKGWHDCVNICDYGLVIWKSFKGLSRCVSVYPSVSKINI